MNKLKIRLLTVMITGFLAGCVPSPFYCWSLEATDGIYHKVEQGQTLWRIALTYQISLEEIAKANGIRDITAIKIGQKIFIPGAKQVLTVEVVKPEHKSRFAHSDVSISQPVSTPSIKDTVPLSKPTSIVITESKAPSTVIAETSRQVETVNTFIWPIYGKIISSFGLRNGQLHKGIDIKASTGTPIRAVADGRVTESNKMNGYGNVIIISHDNEYTTLYAHNESNLVQEGDDVVQGQIIGTVGQTGRASTSHLHFEVWEGVIAKEPLSYLP